MQGLHGVTATTPDHLLLDVGVVYLGAVSPANKIGATRGGIEWNLNRTIRNMEADGAIGDVKGMKRRENVRPTLTVNALEMTLANLQKFIPGANLNGTTITGGEIATADYIDEINVVGRRSDGATVTVKLLNCLPEGDLSGSLNDNDEAVLSPTFVAHFDPSDLDTEPWSISIVPA